jgi:hypothetical protein
MAATRQTNHSPTPRNGRRQTGRGGGRLPGGGRDDRVTTTKTFKTFYEVLREAAGWLTCLRAHAPLVCGAA